MNRTYSSQVQDGFVFSFTVLLVIFVTELCRCALYELKGLQHGGRVGHVGFTGRKVLLFVKIFQGLRLSTPLSFIEDGSVPLTMSSLFFSEALFCIMLMFCV